MRVLKWFFGIVLLLVAVFVIGGMLLPRDVAVARSIDIDASAEEIFPYINSLKAAAEWSPWLGRDPEIQLSYTGPDAGVGAALAWTSEHPQVGNGSQLISASVENERVVTDLDFGDMGTASAEFVLRESGEAATNVTWGFTADMGSGPVGRWMGLMMDSWVGADYEAGLNNLKSLVEAN